jgi:hypothetical protein
MHHNSSVSLRLIAATGFAFVAMTSAVSAAAEGLQGSWSGSGSVELPSGATEKARCKASFQKQGGKSYAMNAVCASSSARAAQTATLEQVGANRYAGEFNNAEYGVSGSISITVNGSSLSAQLKGGGGQAFFNLSR